MINEEKALLNISITAWEQLTLRPNQQLLLTLTHNAWKDALASEADTALVCMLACSTPQAKVLAQLLSFSSNWLLYANSWVAHTVFSLEFIRSLTTKFEFASVLSELCWNLPDDLQ